MEMRDAESFRGAIKSCSSDGIFSSTGSIPGKLLLSQTRVTEMYRILFYRGKKKTLRWMWCGVLYG